MFLSKAELRKTCHSLLDDFEGILSWGWDSRSETLLAEFTTDKEKEVRAVLGRHLNQQWDNKTIFNAPERIKTATGNLGDLRTNQLLFTSDPESQALIFAAWWPWGNGKVISVRIASPTKGEEVAVTRKGLLSKIMGVFN